LFGGTSNARTGHGRCWRPDDVARAETGHEYTTYLDALWGASKRATVVDQTGAGSYELAATALATSANNTGTSVLFKKTRSEFANRTRTIDPFFYWF
jgi:methyl coenzyme M reductase alpha subunit